MCTVSRLSITIMTNPSLQDGSAGDPDATSQAQILLHIKKLLTEARVCLDALDQSTIAGLHFDKEYKDCIVHLLSPFPTAPLSTIVNKALKSGIEAVTSQLASLLLSLDLDVGATQDKKGTVDPSTTAGTVASETVVPSTSARLAAPDITKPEKKRNMTSRYQSIIGQWKRGKKSTSVSPAPSLRVVPDSRPALQSLVVPQPRQLTKEMSHLVKIQQNRRMMATIYFIEGGKKDSITMPHLVEEMNKTQPVIAAGGVSYAWETVRGDIVIAFCVPQTYVTWKASVTMLAPFGNLWTEGSSAYLRFGGEGFPMYVLDLEVVKGEENQISWPMVVKEIHQELEAAFLVVHSKSAPALRVTLTFLEGRWSKRWMRLEVHSSPIDIRRLAGKDWPRSYKRMHRYQSRDVEIEIRMNLLCHPTYGLEGTTPCMSWKSRW